MSVALLVQLKGKSSSGGRKEKVFLACSDPTVPGPGNVIKAARSHTMERPDDDLTPLYCTLRHSKQRDRVSTSECSLTILK